MLKKHTLSLLLALANASSIFAQLTPELLATLPKVGNPVVSPDGLKVAYTVDHYNLQENKGDKDLYVIQAAGGKPKMVAGGKGSQFHPHWINNTELAFLSSESGEVQLYRINFNTSLKIPVTNIPGGITDYAFSADASTLIWCAEVKTTKDIQDLHPDLTKTDARVIDDLFYRHWDAWDDFKNTHVFLGTRKDGLVYVEGIDLMANETFDAEEVALSPTGGTIAYTSKKLNGRKYAESTDTDIYLIDIKTLKLINSTQGNPGYDRNPVFSPDGKYLAYTSMKTAEFESDKATLMVYELSNGKKTDLTPQSEESASSLVWASDSKSLYYISGTQATYQAYKVDVSQGAKPMQLTNGQHDLKSLAIGTNKLFGTKVSMTEPAEIVSIGLNGNINQLTYHTDSLWKNVPKAKVEKHMVKTTDGKEMLVWMVLPPNFDPSKKYPTLLYCQGGPQSAVSQFFSNRWNLQLMASNEYIVVAPNRRGLPTFGKAWNDDISGDWGGQAMKDYLSAIDYAATFPYVNKDKLGAVGASYGGYSVYMLAGIHQKRFKAFIAHCGLFNLESWYGTTEELFFANYDIKGPYWKSPQPKSYSQFSPHKFVQKWDTPILVIHGEKDFRVPIGEGMQAFQAAQLQNIPSRFLYFPDEGHWVQKPQNAVVWQREFFRWLDTYLK